MYLTSTHVLKDKPSWKATVLLEWRFNSAGVVDQVNDNKYSSHTLKNYVFLKDTASLKNVPKPENSQFHSLESLLPLKWPDASNVSDTSCSRYLIHLMDEKTEGDSFSYPFRLYLLNFEQAVWPLPVESEREPSIPSGEVIGVPKLTPLYEWNVRIELGQKAKVFVSLNGEPERAVLQKDWNRYIYFLNKRTPELDKALPGDKFDSLLQRLKAFKGFTALSSLTSIIDSHALFELTKAKTIIPSSDPNISPEEIIGVPSVFFPYLKFIKPDKLAALRASCKKLPNSADCFKLLQEAYPKETAVSKLPIDYITYYLRLCADAQGYFGPEEVIFCIRRTVLNGRNMGSTLGYLLNALKYTWSVSPIPPSRQNQYLNTGTEGWTEIDTDKLIYPDFSIQKDGYLIRPAKNSDEVQRDACVLGCKYGICRVFIRESNDQPMASMVFDHYGNPVVIGYLPPKAEALLRQHWDEIIERVKEEKWLKS